MDNTSLIDLTSTFEEAKTSVPLLPLPRLNSPYEGDVSNDENNPFDWAIEAANNINDPFEDVFKRAQELSSGKSDQCASKDGLKLDIIDTKGIIDMEYENDKTGIQCKHGIEHKSEAEYKNETESRNEMAPCTIEINLDTSDEVHSVNFCSGAQPRYRKSFPETMEPKYCSTPVRYMPSAKKKLEDEDYSPVLKKKFTNDIVNVAAIVRARIKRCIAETEKNFNKHSLKKEKLNNRKSLDSLLACYSNSNCRRETTFQREEKLYETDLLTNYSSSRESKNEINLSFRNLQKCPIVRNYSEATFTYPDKVNSQFHKKSVEPGDDFSLQFRSLAFKATAEYNGHTLANESVVSFIDIDTEEENEQEEKECMEEKLTAELKPTNSVEKDCVGIKMSKRKRKSPETEQTQLQNQQPAESAKSFRSVMSKALGKMHSRKSTSSVEEKFSSDGSGTVGNQQQPPKVAQCSLNRSCSDSTVQCLKKKAQKEKSSKWEVRDVRGPARFSNAVQSPQTKQMQVNSGRVSKPPKPLPKMLRNKKNLLTGKDNKP